MEVKIFTETSSFPGTQQVASHSLPGLAARLRPSKKGERFRGKNPARDQKQVMGGRRGGGVHFA